MTDGDGQRRSEWDWTDDMGVLVFVRGAAPEQLIAAYGLDPATAWMVPPADPAEAVRYPVGYEGGQVIRAGRYGDWAFVIDDLLLENTLGIHGFNVTAHLPEGTEGALVKWTGPEGTITYWTSGGDPVEFDPEADDPADFLERAGADPGLASRVNFEDLDDPAPVHIQLLDLLTLGTGIRLPAEAAGGPLLWCQRPPAGTGPGPRPGTRTGLAWLADPVPEENGARGGEFCVTFIRDADGHLSERGALARFDCDLRAAGSRPWRRGPDPAEPASYIATAQAGRAGEWLFVWEQGLPHRGIRPETLRKASGGTEAVAVRYGSDGAEFACAVDGSEVARVRTSTPPQWEGRDAGRFRELARGLELSGPERPLMIPPLPGQPPRIRIPAGPDTWATRGAARAVLTLAERAFGLSLGEARLARGEWLTVPLLPLLERVWPAPSQEEPDEPAGLTDKVIDLLLRKATDTEISAMLTPRIRSLLATTGMADDPDLAEASEAALGGRPPAVDDSTPAGLALRRLALDSHHTRERNYSPQTPEELERRRQRHRARTTIGVLLAGRCRQALGHEISRQLRDGESSRDQVMNELASARDRCSDDELRQAEAAD